MKRILIAATVAALLAGCAAHVTRTEGRQIEEASAKALEPGVTTRAGVIGAFGEPNDATLEDGVERLTYTYTETTVPTYLGGLVEGRALGKEKTTILKIKLKNGVVSSYSLRTEEDR